uniref:Uncharacterized protein n=1 Tax=Zonotrichia albicollis TaxID=44394 RepID=A0A8D2NDI1_ZONAL
LLVLQHWCLQSPLHTDPTTQTPHCSESMPADPTACRPQCSDLYLQTPLPTDPSDQSPCLQIPLPRPQCSESISADPTVYRAHCPQSPLPTDSTTHRPQCSESVPTDPIACRPHSSESIPADPAAHRPQCSESKPADPTAHSPPLCRPPSTDRSPCVTSHPACSCMCWLCPLLCPQGDTRCLPGSHPWPGACATPPAAQGHTWGHSCLWLSTEPFTSSWALRPPCAFV